MGVRLCNAIGFADLVDRPAQSWRGLVQLRLRMAPSAPWAAWNEFDASLMRALQFGAVAKAVLWLKSGPPRNPGLTVRV
jgi:hypothetical protein